MNLMAMSLSVWAMAWLRFVLIRYGYVSFFGSSLASLRIVLIIHGLWLWWALLCILALAWV